MATEDVTLPNLPVFYDMKYVDDNGLLTSDAHLYLDGNYQTLNLVVQLINDIANSLPDNSGNVNYTTLKAPQRTTAQINGYASDTDYPVGSLWFDTDVAKLKVKTAAGTVKTITTT